MTNKLLYRLTDRMPCRLIHSDGQPYLERYYVGRALGRTWYLHRYVGPDGERHVHNHPYNDSVSFILAGAYTEEVVTDLTADGPLVEARLVRWFNRIKGSTFHRIAEVRPGTWTLFGYDRRARIAKGACSVAKGWGFLSGTVFQPMPSTSDDWWRTAPIGARTVGRCAL